MPRPKKGIEEPAVDKARRSFWKLLEKKPYANMTVVDVLKEAGINKNAFYYHYGNLDDLANDAVRSTLKPELIISLIQGFMGSNRSIEVYEGSSQVKERFNRLCLAAGKHGSTLLHEALKDSIRSAWFQMLNVNRAKIGLDSALATEFALGGIISLLAYRDGHRNDMDLPMLFETAFAKKLGGTIPPMLIAAFIEDGALAEPSSFDLARFIDEINDPQGSKKPATE